MKFKAYRKGNIMFGVGPSGKEAESYKRDVGHYHTGVDWTIGWAVPVRTDNAGYVYKIHRFEETASGWQAVWLLVPEGDHFVEVCYGHLLEVHVKVGQWVKEDQVVGLEGNRGEVYSGGRRITKAMQLAGSKEGHHVHEQYRPVRAVWKVYTGRHYLNNTDGSRYRDKLGRYYEIIHENEQQGCIDPLAFTVSSPAEKLEAIAAALEAKNDPDASLFRRFVDILKRNGFLTV